MGRFTGMDETVALNYEGGEWQSVGLVANPSAGAIFADTGELDEGIYDFDLYITASVAVLTYFEHRNAANTVTIVYQAVWGMALFLQRVAIRGYKMKEDERLRVINIADIVGFAQASIISTRRIC